MNVSNETAKVVDKKYYELVTLCSGTGYMSKQIHLVDGSNLVAAKFFYSISHREFELVTTNN